MRLPTLKFTVNDRRVRARWIYYEANVDESINLGRTSSPCLFGSHEAGVPSREPLCEFPRADQSVRSLQCICRCTRRDTRWCNRPERPRLPYSYSATAIPASRAMESYSFISADLAKTRKAHGFKRSCASPRDSITAGVSHPLSPHRSSAESSILCQRPGGIGSRSSIGV
jgi:hypothetical protein